MDRAELAANMDHELRRSARARAGAAAAVDQARWVRRCNREVVEEARELRARLSSLRRAVQAPPPPS